MSAKCEYCCKDTVVTVPVKVNRSWLQVCKACFKRIGK
jgi:ribosome-binding protein aMBF1 (putative translation factor)